MSALSSKVRLRLSATKLLRQDILSPSDAYAIVYTKRGLRDTEWNVELARTEVCRDNDDPAWTTPIDIVFKFEEVQPLKIVIFDHDDLKDHDYIGEIETNVGRIMGSRGATQVVTLTDHGKPAEAAGRRGSVSHSRGILTIAGMELKGGEQESLRISFRCSHLEKKDWFGKSDPYITVCAPLPSELQAYKPGALLASGAVGVAAAAPGAHGGTGGTWMPPGVSAEVGKPHAGSTGRNRLWTSKVLKGTLDPSWAPVALPIPLLCGGDKDRPLVIECWDWNRVNAHELIGSSPPVSVNELLALAQAQEAKGVTSLPLFNPLKMGKGSYVNSGLLHISSASIQRAPSLLDYILGGTQINLVVAVDFTGSNGDPRKPDSLHFCPPTDPRMPPHLQPLNSYGQAIVQVGTILQEYDSDKSFPAYGFGGSYQGHTRHCFPLNGNEAAPEVQGVEGLLNAYRYSLTQYGLSGPTLFAPILDQTRQVAGAPPLPSQSNQRYTVLLLLTDGAVTDEDETVRAIVEASSVPLSIIIVGVGNADFSTMRMLDGDGAPLAHQGRCCERDVVQFVPFVQFQSYPDAPARLAAEVLAEVPKQLVQFFSSRGIQPNPPLPAHHMHAAHGPPAAGAVAVPLS